MIQTEPQRVLALAILSAPLIILGAWDFFFGKRKR